MAHYFREITDFDGPMGTARFRAVAAGVLPPKLAVLLSRCLREDSAPGAPEAYPGRARLPARFPAYRLLGSLLEGDVARFRFRCSVAVRYPARRNAPQLPELWFRMAHLSWKHTGARIRKLNLYSRGSRRRPHLDVIPIAMCDCTIFFCRQPDDPASFHDTYCI